MFSSVQSLSCVPLFATLWTTEFQASLSITNSRSLLKLMSIESVMPSNHHLLLCHPLLLLPSIFPSISSVQFSCSFMSDSATPWTVPCKPSLSITNSQSSLKIMSIELMMPSNYLILCHPLLRPPSIFPSIRLFSNESALCIRWPKYWSFSFNISPSNEHPGLVGSPCSPRDSQESSPRSQFKIISSSALSFLYSQTLTSIHDYWKTIALVKWTFAGKVMSLLFNMLSRLVLTFLRRSKHLLISWLQSPSPGISELPKIKSVTVSPSICHEVMEPDAMILVFWMFTLLFSLSSRGFLVLLHFLP